MCVLCVCMYVCVCLCAPTYTPISPCLGPDAPDLVCGNAAAEHGIRNLHPLLGVAQIRICTLAEYLRSWRCWSSASISHLLGIGFAIMKAL
jgi:hypothetical protein